VLIPSFVSAELGPHSVHCEVDGSYEQCLGNGEDKQGSAAILISRGTNLIRYSTLFFQAISPLQAELQAFLLSVDSFQRLAISQVRIFTNSK
jgi:ribonuclease HI